MFKLDIQMFNGQIYDFIVNKNVSNNQVTVTITPDDSEIDAGVDVDGNKVYVDDSSTFSLEGWTKANDGYGSLYKVYTENATETVTVDYTTTNANVFTFSTTITVTEISTEPVTPDEPDEPVTPTNKYTKVGWKDDEEGNTPVDADSLNHMDNAIYNLYKNGATSKVIVVQGTEPTDETTITWIDTTEEGNGSLSEVVNSLSGNETTKAPSVQAVKNKFNELTTYSTEETIIGTWINGKPIYRKVIISTMFKTDFYNISSNIDEFVNQRGYVQRKDYPDIINYIPSKMSGDLDISFLANNKNDGIQISWGSSWETNHETIFNKIILIVEYTKTTDTAISTVSEEA